MDPGVRRVWGIVMFPLCLFIALSLFSYDWQDIGVIAGNIPIGMGLVVGGPKLPHDGTVSVEETELRGATDSIVVHESHLSILMSAQVASQVVIFLQTGKFDQETTTPFSS